MNRVTALTTLTALAAAAPGAFAADFNNHVEIGAGALATGYFNLRYERNVNDFLAGAVAAGFSPRGYVMVDDTGDAIAKWTFVNVNAHVKLYPLGTFRSLYFQAEVDVEQHRLSEAGTGAKSATTLVWPAMLIGWRWVIAHRATITAAAGSGYLGRDLSVGATTVDLFDVRPRVDLNLGFLF